jgi:hypothetical protein
MKLIVAGGQLSMESMLFSMEACCCIRRLCCMKLIVAKELLSMEATVCCCLRRLCCMKLIAAIGLLSVEAMLLYTETMLYKANSCRWTVVYGRYVV